MPTDNDAWKARCLLLQSVENPQGTARVPYWVAAATHGLPGPQFTEFGWDRDRAGQHYVACTFFYLGAIADHQRGKGHADRVHARESATMGLIETKLAIHQTPSLRENMTADHAKLAEIPKPALTIPQEQAMLDAASTMPLSPPHVHGGPVKPHPGTPKR